MFIIDSALAELAREEKPIRVGLVGAGFSARGFMLQMLTCVYGMKLVAVSNRTRSNIVLGCEQASFDNFRDVTSPSEIEAAIEAGVLAITDDPSLLTGSDQIDVIVEATGTATFASVVISDAIEKRKHVVLLNSELDATLGPILHARAKEQGVQYTQADGDQPGVLMNLYREVSMLGFKPVMVGNMKTLLDVRRTPETQAQWAAEHFQQPKMVTSFADGTKLGAEMATIANATGFPVSCRGMEGPHCDRVDDAHRLFSLDMMLDTGLTDYVIGAEPRFGIFVLATCDQPIRARYMNFYNMGKGPLYTFYRPFHLSPLEVPRSIARAFLFNDPTLAPAGKPVCDVVTLAKRDIKTGERLDGIGGFLTYGAIDNYETSIRDDLLPIGLAEDCIAERDIPMDQAIGYADIKLPANRLADRLREEQNNRFFP